jgi:hypothetical protein
MTNQPNDPKPPKGDKRLKPPYLPLVKDDGSPAELWTPQALIFALNVMPLGAPAFRLAHTFLAVAYRWKSLAAEFFEVSFDEWERLTGLWRKSIFDGLAELVEYHILEVRRGTGKQSSSYRLLPQEQWLAFPPGEHKMRGSVHPRQTQAFTPGEHKDPVAFPLGEHRRSPQVNATDLPIKHYESKDVSIKEPTRSTYEEVQGDGRDGSSGILEEAARIDQVEDGDHQAQLPEIVGATASPVAAPPSAAEAADHEPEEVLMSDQNPTVPTIVKMRENAILQRSKRSAQLARFVRGNRVNHHLHGDGVVVSLYSGKVVVRFAGDQLAIDAAELTLL